MFDDFDDATFELTETDGWGPALVRRAIRYFGNYGKLMQVIHKDPYALTYVPMIGFLRADAVAKRLGIETLDPRRQRAVAIHTMEEDVEGEGHTAVEYERFLNRTRRWLGPGADDCEYDPERIVFIDDMLSLANTYEAEKASAEVVKRMAKVKLTGLKIEGKGLFTDQIAALKLIQKAQIFCLLGSPGTGKTTMIKALAASNQYTNIAVCAPTGKAAKRITQATGLPATTIHRLLEVDVFSKYDSVPSYSRNFSFVHNRERLLTGINLVIVDESSMIDSLLFADLVTALQKNTRLVLIGDPNQLASVGPGRVLYNLCASGIVPYTELTKLKRHDPKLMIASNCKAIRFGLMPEIDNTQAKDFFLIERETADEVRDTVIRLASQTLPQKKKADPTKDIAILVAMRDRDKLSALAFNKRLRAVFNPEAAVQNPDDFSVGDRVIQLSNNYFLDVMNGDTGTIIKIDKADGTATIRFDVPERTVKETLDEDNGRGLFNLDFAWALTVHKAQGSEWPYVIIPVNEAIGPWVTDRHWIYTAISRAKKACYLVGDRQTLFACIQRIKPQLRNTRLPALLNA